MADPPRDRDRALLLDIVLSARDALSFVDGRAGGVVFVRAGTHSELFKPPA